jgi:predicted GNAT family acetyltransferase
MSDSQVPIPAAGARTIAHQPERQRFVTRIGGAEAVLEYRLLAGGGIDFCHTHVPEASRGRGVAESLVRAGLAWARGENLRVQASCWYVQRLLRA